MQPLAFLSPLRHHRRPPAHTRGPQDTARAIAAPKLGSVVKNVWQEESHREGRRLTVVSAISPPSTQQAPRAPLRADKHLLHGRWSLRKRIWPSDAYHPPPGPKDCGPRDGIATPAQSARQTQADALLPYAWEYEGRTGRALRARGSLMLINKEQPGSLTSDALLWPCLGWQHPAS